MRYLTFKELREKLGGRGRTTIYRDIAAKRLPQPFKLGGINYFSERLVDEAMMREQPARDISSVAKAGQK